ncbi:MAG: glycosyltransferase family 39 protein [Gammaproteobacteria bacterium]|nr:glycosyltransferase family 39 protein [Gammaproteobacteria bacterium]
MSETQKNWLLDILLLCLVIGSLFTFMLGSRPLSVPDESRYSEIPREMLVSHDFITPHINAIKYFEKPPLFYWMQAASLKMFGINEWSARFMNALMALLGCLGTYVTARKLYDRKTGWFAAITLATSLLYFVMARVVTLDMTVSVLVCFSLFSFILESYYWVYIFAALAVLTKGLIGIIFPGAIIFLWLCFTGRWRILKECKLFKGTLLFLAITLPWHILCQLKNPEFLHYYFITQQFSRYFTMSAGRYQPMWYYIPILLLGLFPWTGYLVGVTQTTDRKNSSDLFSLIAASFIFIFYSVSHSKLTPYILPCMPFLAILFGKYFASENKSKLSLRCGALTSSFICIGLAIAAYTQLKPEVSINFIQTKLWTETAIVILAGTAILVPLVLSLRNFLNTYITQVICFTLFIGSLCSLAPTIYMDSIKPLAEKIQPLRKPGDMVATYHYYYQDLPFYLNQTISIVNWKGELEFGEKYTPPSEALITDETLWKTWTSKRRVFLFVPDTFYSNINRLPYGYYIIAQDKQDMVITNQPPEKS